MTDALEKSTRKYFDQLDINADLSNKIGKLGAEGAVNKVRADKLEIEVNTIREELEAKIEHYKEKLASINVDDIKNDLSKLNSNFCKDSFIFFKSFTSPYNIVFSAIILFDLSV